MDLTNFNPSCDEHIAALMNIYEEAESYEIAYYKLINFADKYFLPHHIWETIFGAINEINIENEEDSYIGALSDYHMFHPGKDEELDQDSWFLTKKLYFNDRSPTLQKYYMKNQGNIGGLKNNLDMLIPDLQYPHCNLDTIWSKYEKGLSSFPPKNMVQTYKKMKELYPRIKMAKETQNGKDWGKALKESGHHEFICSSVEYEIGCFPFEIDLWKWLIKYLKSHDIKRMLHTYSKFCRFFTNDFEIKKEYQNAAKEYGIGIKVPWKNVFPWEIYDPKFIDKNYAPSTTSLPKKRNDSIQCRFTSQNAMRQDFPFKSTMLHYIQQNASAEILHKLQNTCKFFALKNPYHICYKLIMAPCHPLSHGITFHEQSMKVAGGILSGFEKIFVSTVLRIYEIEREILAESLSKIFRCTAKYIFLTNVILKTKEMEFLINGRTVEYFDLNNVKVCDPSNGIYMKVEDMLQMIPKVKHLRIIDSITTPEILQQMLQISFQNKLDHFAISFSDISHFNNELFGQFIIKNCSSKCDIFHYYSNEEFEMFHDFIDESQNFIKNLIETHWNNERQKPKFSQFFPQ